MQPFARLLLELLNGFPQVTLHELRVQSTRSSVLDTTYFFVPSIARAKGIIQSSIQSGHVPAAVGRHAASIIS